MGAIHRVIPDDRPGQVWWFHGNSGSGKTNIALKFDVPNKVILDADDLREIWGGKCLPTVTSPSRQAIQGLIISATTVQVMSGMVQGSPN